MMDYDSDNSELMPKVFAVDDDDDDVNFAVPPTSGQEYLRRVMLEAKKCPLVMVADVSADSNVRNISVVPKCNSLHPAPRGYAPTLGWQKQQEADFAEVRQRLVRHKALMKKSGKTKCTIPEKDDVSGWCTLCFGRLNVSRPKDKTPAMNEIDNTTCSDSEASDVSASQHISCHGGTPPLLSIVTHMDQPTIMKVLEYHVNWLEKTGFTVEQGRWFYGLLACLEKPLEPEACALIRNLARHCSTLRATLESEKDERLSALNLLICLVAHYFGQSDLSDTS